MIKFLLTIMAMLGENNKFIKFLIEVFQTPLGEITKRTKDIINECVQNTENIAKYIIELSTDATQSIDSIIDSIKKRYGYSVTVKDVTEVIREFKIRKQYIGNLGKSAVDIAKIMNDAGETGISEESVMKVMEDKGYSKFSFAKNMILRRVAEESIEVSMQVVDTAIQLAVTRFFSKK